jgi:flagellar biosynthesis GTPase FlhF
MAALLSLQPMFSSASVDFVGIAGSSSVSDKSMLQTLRMVYSYAKDDMKIPRHAILAAFSADDLDLELIVDGIAESDGGLSIVYMVAPLVYGQDGCHLVFNGDRFVLSDIFNNLQNTGKDVALFLDTDVSEDVYYRCLNRKTTIPKNVIVISSWTKAAAVKSTATLRNVSLASEVSDLGLVFLEALSRDKEQADGEYLLKDAFSFLKKNYIGQGGYEVSSHSLHVPKINESSILMSYEPLFSLLKSPQAVAQDDSVGGRVDEGELNKSPSSVNKSSVAKGKAGDSSTQGVGSDEPLGSSEDAAGAESLPSVVKANNKAQEKLARETEEKEKLAKQTATKEKIAKEKAAKEKRAKDKAAKALLARQKADKKKALENKILQQQAKQKAEREELEKLENLELVINKILRKKKLSVDKMIDQVESVYTQSGLASSQSLKLKLAAFEKITELQIKRAKKKPVTSFSF